MDDRGHVHMLETAPDGRTQFGDFATKEPMPESCNARKVLSALSKLSGQREVTRSDSALLPLTPFEQGYVLGVLAEYRAWRDRQP